MTELQLRKRIMATALRMNGLGINRGKSGNVSARWKTGFLVTPSGLAYEKTRPSDIVFVDAAGRPSGHREPSSEWRFHHDIYRDRPESMAIVQSVATLARLLGLAVIAEGVETSPQRLAVAAAGCPFAQGYLFSRPVDVARVPEIARATLGASIR